MVRKVAVGLPIAVRTPVSIAARSASVSVTGSLRPVVMVGGGGADNGGGGDEDVHPARSITQLIAPILFMENSSLDVRQHRPSRGAAQCVPTVRDATRN